MLQKYFGTLPEICTLTQSYLETLWTISLISWLGYALTFTVNCGTLYGQVCAFPNDVQSFEFTTGGLQSSGRNISRMINGNKMHLSSTSSLIAKGLTTCVFALSLWCIVCRLMSEKKTIKSILE